MDYRALTMKDDPFEGLSLDEAKKLVVYFSVFATPKMSAVDIFRKYGYCLPDCGMTLFEHCNLCIEVAKELVRGY